MEDDSSQVTNCGNVASKVETSIRNFGRPSRLTLSPMTTTTKADAEAQVRSWGFSNVFTWTDAPNGH